MLNTEIGIPTKYWNKKHRRISADLPPHFGDAATLNEELQRMLRLAEDIVSFTLKNNIADPLQFEKETFDPHFDLALLPKKLGNTTKIEEQKKEVANINFFFQFDEYIQFKKKKVSPGMLKVFNNTKTVLKDFKAFRKKEIKFDEIDLQSIFPTIASIDKPLRF